jgi:Glycosyl hydrolases family 2, TIM barrel domain/Glycosyl hydrolases family 2, sugar binding domain
MHPRSVAVAGSLLVVLSLLAACAPRPRPGSLRPTLTLTEDGGATVAMQNGIPVPTFEPQARRGLRLDGTWRVERRVLDHGLSLTERASAMPALLAEAAGREQPDYDDAAWDEVVVPGTLNPPPVRETGGWYRRAFYAPRPFGELATTLKIGSANYVADVWLNGAYLGYHEGGSTPFAFDVSASLQPGKLNVLAIRVDNPPWGTRNDIVPWGLADWWNYGGLTGSVWIEATPSTQLVRADVVSHLDGADVSIVVRRATDRAEVPAPTSVRVEVFAAEVTPQTLTRPTAADLVPDGARPLVADTLDLPDLRAGGTAVIDTSFLLGGADRWSPAHPALYALRVAVINGGGVLQASTGDELWTTFGLRRITVDAEAPRILLNGEPVLFTGVGIHDEVLQPGPTEASTTAHPAPTADELLATLGRAAAVDASLIRTGHTPANPLLLTLADRLGFAVWEEIPLYHYTPLTFGIAMQRGIPQQMLTEMVLRDMNHASVLFHGLANESTGTDERARALATLAGIDRALDGTRLLGQAAYGFSPDDPTQAALDVAGYTFYYGVFYGTDAAAGTATALETAHATWPDKPLMALEFGRWADDRNGPSRQEAVLADTYPQLAERSGRLPDGYVGGAVWWSLEDFATMRPGIGIEHFGLYDGTGAPRPAAAAARTLFTDASGGGATQQIEPMVRDARVAAPAVGADLRLVGYLAYGLAVSLALLAVILLGLVRRGGRSTGRRQA